MARLSNRSVFTLLNLKDGFHQIKPHPDHTKYFSFAIPDGQFECMCLRFGYYEAPEEFQKRSCLVHVLQPLIRVDQVIVYMDDILIPSVSVDENQNTLKKSPNVTQL